MIAAVYTLDLTIPALLAVVALAIAWAERPARGTDPRVDELAEKIDRLAIGQG